MGWASKIYQWMTRFNTVALTFILASIIVFFICDQYRHWTFTSEGRLGNGMSGERYGAAAAPATPMSGQEIRTPGGDLVSYYVAEDAESFEWDEGQNISIVNLSNGNSYKILADDDPRAVLDWQLIRKDGENPIVYVGYVAWAATKEQYDQGRADLLVSALPNVKQYTLGTNIKYAYLPKVMGDESMAIIMWPEEDEANFVSFDLETGMIIERKEIDLPKFKKNFLSMNHGLPVSKFARLDHISNSAPVNVFGYEQ